MNDYDEDPGKKNARSTDDDTSHEAANHVFKTGKAQAQALRCLLALQRLGGEGTASEIDVMMGCIGHSVFWRRRSDLLGWHMVRKTGEARKGVHPGCHGQGVVAITDYGRAVLRQFGVSV